MLASATRFGPGRQVLSKSVTMLGGDHQQIVEDVARATFASAGGLPVAVSAEPGGAVWRITTGPVWLGTQKSRSEVFGQLGAVVVALTTMTGRAGARVLPTGIGLGFDSEPAVSGDIHELEVADTVEQEVLCNLLRQQSATLIALTGRPRVMPGRSPDRVGSRWLSTSSQHLATRFLESTSPEHLTRVVEDLRRSEGIAEIESMDVAPFRTVDGTPFVRVRCIDSAVSLSSSRMLTILLGAMVVRARRLVQAGQRKGKEPQRLVDANRARAISGGMRSTLRFEVDRQHFTGTQRSIVSLSASEAGRRMVRDLLPDLRSMEAGAEELAPLVLPLDFPLFGAGLALSETEILAGIARRGADELSEAAAEMLRSWAAGGPLLRAARRRDSGITALILDGYNEELTGDATSTAEGID